MLIRTLASVATGVAVFIFTLSVGLELAVAWGVISFVLNYIPYVGSLIAVVLPVIFATAQFVSLADGRFHFWKFLPDPIRHRQLPGAHSDRQCAFNFTLRDAIGVFSMGLSLGHAWRLHRAPGDDRAFHDLATEPFDALDRKSHVNNSPQTLTTWKPSFRRSCGTARAIRTCSRTMYIFKSNLFQNFHRRANSTLSSSFDLEVVSRESPVRLKGCACLP